MGAIRQGLAPFSSCSGEFCVCVFDVCCLSLRHVTFCFVLFCVAVCCVCVCVRGGGALEAREKPVVHPKVVPSGLGSCGWLAFRQGDRIGRKRVEALLHLVVVEDIYSVV